jgi:hypothetical protein
VGGAKRSQAALSRRGELAGLVVFLASFGRRRCSVSFWPASFYPRPLLRPAGPRPTPRRQPAVQAPPHLTRSVRLLGPACRLRRHRLRHHRLPRHTPKPRLRHRSRRARTPPTSRPPQRRPATLRQPSPFRSLRQHRPQATSSPPATRSVPHRHVVSVVGPTQPTPIPSTVFSSPNGGCSSGGRPRC